MNIRVPEKLLRSCSFTESIQNLCSTPLLIPGHGKSNKLWLFHLTDIFTSQSSSVKQDALCDHVMGRSHKGIVETLTPALVHSGQKIRTQPSPPTSSSEKIASCLWKPTGSINCLKQTDCVSLHGPCFPTGRDNTSESKSNKGMS